jgi:NTE family protein
MTPVAPPEPSDPQPPEPGAGVPDALARRFGPLDPAIVRLIEAELDTVALPAGAVLLRQGERTSDVYLVLSGRLRASVRDAGGVERPVGDIGRGETIGELALITGEPRMATITALRDCVLARLGREAFGRILASSPEVALAMMRLVIDRFRQAEGERTRARAAAVLAIWPLDGTDPAPLARNLVAELAPAGRKVTLLPAATVAALGPDALRQRVAALERGARTVLLVLDGRAGPATVAALALADEALLVARADAAARTGEPERSLLATAAAESGLRRTLVLLHPPDCRAPAGTARWLDSHPVDRHLHIRPERPDDMRRLARAVSGRSVGLVLAGGAARAIAHIGVLRALAEHGIRGDIVGGSSMGAIIAAWHAMEVEGDDLVAACDRAFGRNPSGDYNLIPLVSLVRGERTSAVTLAEVLHRCGREIDTADTWRTWFCVASDFTDACETVLTRGPLHRNILASYAIPGIFPPQIIGGHLMYDGGTFNNFPVDVMARMGAGRIIGVDMLMGRRKPVELSAVPPPAHLLFDRFRRVADRRYRLPSLPETLLTACFITSDARQQATAARADLHIRPQVARIGLLDWSRRHDAIAQGYEHASRQLSGLPKETLDLFR